MKECLQKYCRTVYSHSVAYLPDNIRILVFSQLLTGICDTIRILKLRKCKQHVEIFRLEMNIFLDKLMQAHKVYSVLCDYRFVMFNNHIISVCKRVNYEL